MGDTSGFSPQALQRLMDEHQIPSIYQLHKRSGIDAPRLYRFFGGKCGLSIGARQKLAALFPEARRELFVEVMYAATKLPRKRAKKVAT
ncbi:MAG: helix-turn-helix domain-containing protein [Patescibacteria group bacterium]|nr:helix-turn-helix domain-containing protein [Patescibacteria group bacterium]